MFHATCSRYRDTEILLSIDLKDALLVLDLTEDFNQ